MGDLSQVIPKLATALAQVAGIVTVHPYVPEQAADIGSVPAILIDVGPATVSARSNIREIAWPIDLWVLVTRDNDGPATLEQDLAACLPFPERIIARLDACRTFDGLLTKAIQYAEPAVESEQGGAFGPIPWKGASYVGTSIHIVCSVERQGGF